MVKLINKEINFILKIIWGVFLSVFYVNHTGLDLFVSEFAES